MPTHAPQAARQIFHAYLRERGLKQTREREEILDEIFSSRGHFEADDLAMRLRERKARVSKATIYRTLPLLLECGLLREVIFGQNRLHYEPILGRAHHEHMICEECGAIIEFVSEEIERLQAAVCQDHGFLPRSHRLEIVGLCQECQAPEPVAVAS